MWTHIRNSSVSLVNMSHLFMEQLQVSLQVYAPSLLSDLCPQFPPDRTQRLQLVVNDQQPSFQALTT